MIGERKKPLSDFGIEVKLALMKQNKTQNWLIDEISKICPTMFVDSSVLHKVITGQVQSGKIVNAIRNILEMQEEP